LRHRSPITHQYSYGSTHQYSYGSTAHDLSYAEHSLGVTTFSIRVWPGGPLRALLFICVLRCAFAPGDAANTKHGASLTSSASNGGWHDSWRRRSMNSSTCPTSSSSRMESSAYLPPTLLALLPAYLPRWRGCMHRRTPSPPCLAAVSVGQGEVGQG
jgi:hypothetical protein